MHPVTDVYMLIIEPVFNRLLCIAPMQKMHD